MADTQKIVRDINESWEYQKNIMNYRDNMCQSIDSDAIINAMWGSQDITNYYGGPDILAAELSLRREPHPYTGREKVGRTHIDIYTYSFKY